jgi:hypothetical protein
MSNIRMSADVDVATDKFHCCKTNSKFSDQQAPIYKEHSKKPSLTIIDFNQLTRGGLDLAISKNRVNVDLRQPMPRRKIHLPKRQ